MPRKYANRLSYSLFLGSLTFFLLFGLVVGYLGYQSYERDLYRETNTRIADILRLTKSQIDADDLAQCIATGETSPSYQTLQAFLDKIKDFCDIDFIYVVKPLRADTPDNMMDVIAGVSTHERAHMADKLTYLGKLTGYAYPPEVAQYYLDRMERSDEIAYFANATEFGRAYTGLLPIVDSQGDPVAVLAVDVSVDEMDATLRRYVVQHVTVTLLLSCVFVAAMLYWLRRRVISPLKLIEGSLRTFVRRAHNDEYAEAQDLQFDKPDVHTGDEIESLADSLATVSDDMRRYVAALLTAHDEVADMRSRMEVMGELAYRDALTGVNNSTSYAREQERINNQIAEGTACFGIVMVDVNDLKHINDTYGHEKGDVYLMHASSTIGKVFERSSVFRIGGDEFVVVLEGPDLEDRERLEEEARAVLEEHRADALLDPWDRVSFAMGMAVFDPQTDTDVDDVFRRADAAMYDNKQEMKAGRA